MFCPYHKQQTIPLTFLVLMGIGVIIATFINRGFHPILLTLLPGLAFTVFYCLCIFHRERKPWHRWAWKASIWWSGIFLFCFFFGFLSPLSLIGASSLLALPFKWSVACGINPFIAVGLHLLAWGCSWDASRNEILVMSEPEGKR